MAVQTKDKAVTLEVLKSAYGSLKTLIDNLTTSMTNSLNGKVPTTRKVNNKALSADITLSHSDVGAVPTSRTINGKPLTGDVTLAFSDLEGAIDIEVDATLTVAGDAADAKATGDAIAGVQSSVNALNSKAFSWGMLKNGFGWNG